MSTICAWCEKVIEQVVASRQGRQPTSHGICRACLRRQLEAVREAAPLRAA